ncbi:low molecular weight phosphotyrosine protein phosphatase [Rothia sp. ZJ932]|nr:low molecular weight phosphotyrosine protein phosphatase [Rothia sp. ZJ1223]QRZ62646.1 low molecular weight phosphotyrosine protein phosphatase [Rothia sp. ZJ932]
MTVCTGNICRSPTGEYLLKQAVKEAGLDVEVDSSGISNEERGNPIDRRAAKVLNELNISTSAHTAQQFAVSDFASHDLLLAMDLNHYRALKRMAPSEQESAKIRLMREFDPTVADQDLNELGIYDPWYGDLKDFYITYEMIRDAVPGVIEHIQQAQGL